MIDPVYTELLNIMKKRGGDYSGMDIPEFFTMAAGLFTPAEAEVNNAMPKGPFSAQALATSMGRSVEEIEPILEAMANKGLCMAVSKSGTVFYQSARLMPGIFEFQFMSGGTSERDKQIAALIHAYKKAYNQKSDISQPEFPTKRVITVDRTIAANNQVHTYDQVQTYIEKHDQIALTTCYCRHAAALIGEDTHGMPNDVCMQFGMGAQFAVERLNARKITKAEAREVINRAEDASLIHMSMNKADDVEFICNCDRWHCVVVTHALAKPKPGLFFNSGFEPVFDFFFFAILFCNYLL